MSAPPDHTVRFNRTVSETPDAPDTPDYTASDTLEKVGMRWNCTSFQLWAYDVPWEYLLLRICVCSRVVW